MNEKCIKRVLCMATGMVSLALCADYVTLEYSDLLYASDLSAKHSSLVAQDFNTGNWSNREKINNQLDYYIGKNKSGENVYACTPNVENANWIFGGRSLTLDGGVGNMVIKHLSYNQSTMDYTPGTVYLRSGVYAVDKDVSGQPFYSCVIKMTAVVESPESAPFVFSHNTCLDVNYAVNRDMTLNLSGEAGTGIRLTRPESATSLMQWIVAGDSSGYRGTLEVERMNLVARNSDLFKFGGCIRILPDGMFRPLATFGEGTLGAIELAGGTLEIAAGSVVPGRFAANGGEILFSSFHCANPSGTAYGMMRVAGGATLAKRTKIVIGGGDTLAMNTACERGEWPLIIFPAGTEVSADDFELSLNVAVSGMTPDVVAPFWSLAVKDNASGQPTLYAVREKVVVSQDPNYSEHSINDGTKWTSGAAPTAGAAYLAFGSSGRLKVLANDKFGGDHLYCYASWMRLYCETFTVPRFTVLAGTGEEYWIYLEPASVTIDGGVFECVKDLGEKCVTFRRSDAQSVGSLTVASDIVGSGTLSFNIRNQSTETSAFRTLALTGTNDRYAGKMWLNADLTVNVANGTAFGGALDTVTYDAVRFTKCTNGTNPYKLVPTAPVSFDEPTRGWLIGGRVDFSPTEECPLMVRNPITILGGQQKSGAGVLALGGALKFTDSFSDEPGTATDYYLAIRDGWIKPLSADSFNGLRLYFDANSDGIELDWDATGDLKTYGLRNTKAIKESHFQFVNDKTIQIRFDAGDLTEFPEGEHTFGLLTVPTAEADAVFGHVKVVKPFRGVKAILSTRDNGDGTTTLVADCKRLGFSITVK